MSSHRTGYGLPAKPSDGLRTRRPSDPAQQGGIPRPTIRTGKSDNEAAVKASSQPSPGSRLPSRVPQPSVAPRQGSRPSAARRPSVDHQATSWGSASTTSSRSRTHTQSGSGSSSSSKSYDNPSTTKAPRSALRRPQMSSHDAEPSRKEVAGPSSVPVLRSKFAVEPSYTPQVDRYLTESPSELNPIARSEMQKGLKQSPVIYPELDRYRNVPQPTQSSGDQNPELLHKLSTHDLPPPTPASILFSGSSSQLSASPSTKFSGSPGPGPYSRDTTPTSMSSQSPGLTTAAKFNALKNRQLSPAYTRPPVTRRRAGSTPNEDAIDPQGLAAVRESLNSSSSSSTVKDGERNLKERKPAKHLPPPPPSPPPRKSSQKFRKSSEEDNRKSPASSNTKSRSASSIPSPQKASALSPPGSSSGRPAAPRRPSRDGAPDIHSQLLDPAPVVRSNLSSTSLPTERRGSESSDRAPTHQRAKNASTSQLPVGKEAGAGKSPSKSLGVPEANRPSRTPSPSVGSSFRFPFFGRKKANPDSPPKAKTEAKEKKPLRRGPAAGTGHEGYGKVGAIRRRRGSVNLSRGAVGSQSSQESLVSNDAYFADRMNPVVIAGGEVVDNRNPSSELSRTESNQSLSLGRPSTDSRSADNTTLASGSRTTMWPSPNLSAPQTAPSSRRPSESSDSDGPGMKSTLAFRRSVQRLRTSPENPMRLPNPINTGGVASSPMTSFDTSVMSDESHLEMQREVSRGRDTAHPAPKKLTKRDRSPRKWNLFGRSQKQSAVKRVEPAPVLMPPEEKKPVAFYTMMDPSEQDLASDVDIQDILRNADIYPASRHGTPEAQSPGFPAPGIRSGLTRASPQPSQKVYHDPLPSVQPAERMPQASTAQPKPKAQSQTPAQSKPQLQEQARVQAQSQPPSLPPSQPPPAPTTLSSGRPSRLQQVGRIPKVVSQRQEDSSPKIFSRPFRASLQSPPQPEDNLDPESIAKGPSPPNESGEMPHGREQGHYSEAKARPSTESQEQQSREFLRFSPPRKDSEGTVDTSSSSGMFPFAHATAVIPRPEDPPAEDEVWDEYDDFLADGNAKLRISAASSCGTPFYLESFDSKADMGQSLESPTLAPDRIESMQSLGATASSCYSADMTERIRNAFQPHPSPGTPPVEQSTEPAFDNTDDEGDITITVAPAPRKSLSPIKERDSESSYSSSDESSDNSQVNIRFGSLTVSKWLTFGHVIFSDVRHELIADHDALNRRSILVIDGLGNDDWSFYAAETYPGATFYNLSPRAPLPELPASPSGMPLTPANHHQVQFESHVGKFPFAAQSFTSVVYRFPVAAPESHYRNILSEARRVLKPGGYLELSILDVDLNNMGNRGRKAVRNLKEKVHMLNPDTSLSSTADLLVRLVGTAGFYDVKAARVGVPVASPIQRSHNSIRAQDKKSAKKKDQPSLSEMMSDESPAADATITKMVARVGRWWYARCYEDAADDGTSDSMWHDRALLRECEELGTSLKLMVCCGRAPERVLSV